MMLYEEDNLNLYAYCKGNPVYYTDPEGTTVRAAVLATFEFEDEAKNIQDDIEKYYAPETVNFSSYIEDFGNQDMQILGNYWNKLSNRKLVVIDTHGWPNALANRQGSYSLPKDNSSKTSCYLTVSAINELGYKGVDILILLGCNVGHYNVTNNVAEAFSKRISGYVLASDGSVVPGKTNNTLSEFVTFRSVGNELFDKVNKEYNINRDSNYGWILYKAAKRTEGKKIIKTGIYSINMRLVLNYLKNNYGTDLSNNSYK